MSDLQKKKCVPCEGGTPPLTPDRIQEYVKQVKNWKVLDNKRIEKTLDFIDFKRALSFVNKVGDLAEFEGHHPDQSPQLE